MCDYDNNRVHGWVQMTIQVTGHSDRNILPRGRVMREVTTSFLLPGSAREPRVRISVANSDSEKGLKQQNYPLEKS